MPAMIELLGVGTPKPDGGWTLHRVCATFARGEVTLVVSHLPEERDALLDAVVARPLPEEGRVWVAHVPVSRDTVRRIRGMVLKSICARGPSSTARSCGTCSLRVSRASGR